MVKDHDVDIEDEDDMALILEEGESSLYKKVQALINKLEWIAAIK